MKKEFRREVNSPLAYPFETETEGAYAVTVRASCKPGWRNRWWLKLKGFFEDTFDLHLDDEDLRIEIDGIVFKKPKGKKGLFNSPAAFSGTKILGKTKTVIFLLHLAKGSHTIKFIPDGSPYLGEVEINQFVAPLKFVLQPNTRAENENYYAWYTLTVVDQPVYFVSLTAQTGAQQEDNDDDDLKIMIDGEVQKRPGNKHPHAYFCGFSAKGKEETFTKEIKLPKGTHYLELFADKTPLFRSIELTLSGERLLRARVVRDSVNLREEPKTTARVLAQLSRGDTVEVLGKAVKGERPQNEKGLPLLSDRWHQVSTSSGIGFIFSEVLEIEGESLGEIKNLIRKTALRLGQDSDLMLALAGYNFGPTGLPKQGVFDIRTVSQDVQDYVNRILTRSEWYKKQAGFSRQTLFVSVSIFLLLVALSTSKLFFKHSSTVTTKETILGTTLETTPSIQESTEVGKVDQKQEEFKFPGGMIEPGNWELIADFDGDGEREFIRATQQKKRDVFLYFESVVSFINGSEEQVIVEHRGGPLIWLKLVNLDKYGPPEFLFETLEGQLAYTRFYQYREGKFVPIPIVPLRQNGEMFSDSAFLGRNGIRLWETEDKVMIALYKDQLTEKSCPGETELYSYYDGKLIRTYNLCTTPEWSQEFKGI